MRAPAPGLFSTREPAAAAAAVHLKRLGLSVSPPQTPSPSSLLPLPTPPSPPSTPERLTRAPRSSMLANNNHHHHHRGGATPAPRSAPLLGDSVGDARADGEDDDDDDEDELRGGGGRGGGNALPGSASQPMLGDDDDGDGSDSSSSAASAWWRRLACACCRPPPRLARTVRFNAVAGAASPCVTVSPAGPFPPNVVRNTKHTPITFLPLFLYNEFRFFFNLYFLVVALTQFFPVLQVGFLFTYVAPLVVVLVVSMTKEAYDDLQRWRRDRAANAEAYTRLDFATRAPVATTADALAVGDVVLLSAGQRVPCDCVLLRTSDKQGCVFLRTDQLDGETDWKLRRAVAATQRLPDDAALTTARLDVEVEAPRLDIYAFEGRVRARGAVNEPVFKRAGAGAGVGGTPAVAKRGGRKARTTRDGHALLFDDDDEEEEEEEEEEGDTAALSDTNANASNDNNSNAAAADGDDEDALEWGDAEGLSLENTLWANTVVAAGSVAALVVFTGAHTRAALNAAPPTTKTGRLDFEVNQLSKVLFGITLLLAAAMTTLRGLSGPWHIYLFRFVLLFSSIIPISLRVNLDMAKALYSVLIMRDADIAGAVVRSSTIPEELGRVSYLFSDKTGTLTQNKMRFQTLHVAPPLTYQRGGEDGGAHTLAAVLKRAYREEAGAAAVPAANAAGAGVGAGAGAGAPAAYERPFPYLSHGSSDPDREHADADAGAALSSVAPASPLELALAPSFSSAAAAADGWLRDVAAAAPPQMALTPAGAAALTLRALRALALCHMVTPVGQEDLAAAAASTAALPAVPAAAAAAGDDCDADDADEGAFQAASPDEVALVAFAASVGLRLSSRDAHSLSLSTPVGGEERYRVLASFPFTSESKRMGILLQRELPGGDAQAATVDEHDEEGSGIVFLLKGAESALLPRVLPAPWLDEECETLARAGLRTLVFAEKRLSRAQSAAFLAQLAQAKASMGGDRDARVAAVLATIETGLTAVALSGVEDRLQPHVRSSLETLRHAGVRTWMLTGDKAETAVCIGRAARLIDRGQPIARLTGAANTRDAVRMLARAARQPKACLVVDGGTLQLLLDACPWDFVEAATLAPSVICCRCSPTQKADVVRWTRRYTGERTLAIGDGGNDVSMILAADVGVGIVGKEGKQAAMAADFSLLQFAHVVRLLLWHGRNSYKRSASLAQFVMHRGLIISVIQAVFSSLFAYVAVAVYTGWLMVGYTTVFTMLPVFSLVCDTDVSPETAFLFPELYRDLQRQRPLSYRTFFVWCLLSVYQGGLIMILGIVLFEHSFVNIVAITFTALIATELVNVALSVHAWTRFMVLAQLLSALAYLIAVVTLRSYFDVTFIFTWTFLYKVGIITAACTLPPAAAKWLRDTVSPAAHNKVSAGRRG